MSNHLQVGIDFALKQAVFYLASPDGHPVATHKSYANSAVGYAQVKDLLTTTMQRRGFDGLDIAGEATSTYWMPYFLQLASDADLTAAGLRLVLLNPRWVYWHKKSFGDENKADPSDAYYVTEYLRTHPAAAGWSPQLGTWPLRCYTRLRFRLAHQVAGQKCYYLTLLFLSNSAYSQRKPFSDLFGPTSQQVLSHWPELDALAEEDMVELLETWSKHRLSDPLQTAQRLAEIRAESFVVPEPLQTAVQRCLDLTLQQIRVGEEQIATVEGWIAQEAAQHPDVAHLATIPGIGPVCSSGIVAELGDVERFVNGERWDAHRQQMVPRNLRNAEDAVAKIAGLWWPRRESADFAAEDRRMAKTGNRYLRYYLIEAADRMRLSLPDYRLYYEAKYREATKHHYKRALVLTARKAVGLIVGLLHRHEPYRSREERQAAQTPPASANNP